jgi:hypothetical protein
MNLPAQKIIRDIDPYIASLTPETLHFLYSGFYAKRKRRMKHALIVNAIEKDLVKNDYVFTLSNGVKTFLEVNSGLIKHRYKKIKQHPLTAVGRIKKIIFFRYNEVLFLTHRFLGFRNLNLKMSNNHYEILSFTTYARPLNKQLFFSLIQNLNVFSLRFPILIMYNSRKYKRLTAYYLGFRIFLKKKILGSLLNNTPFIRPRRKRYKELKLV